ncbi:uncharacterized protein LOC101758532 [Setaria italica]|uniref:uncharacterized protein LOC101758532 n=1 Tax=Setaria italica TaxID=4555 RepID=UPI000BE4E5B1|nr:uncharacterized protein LOC101758532 [Setaria italica]
MRHVAVSPIFDPRLHRDLGVPLSTGAGAATAMSSIRSALARALVAPKLRGPHQFAATTAAGDTQPERVAAEMAAHAPPCPRYSTGVSPNDSVDLSIKDDSQWSDQDHLKFRVNAIKGLIALLNGETESAAQLFTDGCKDFAGGKHQTESAAFSYSEYLHCVGDFPMATQVYQSVLEEARMEDMSGNLLAAGNMVPEEVSIGTTCSYSQLLSHSGKFGEAEDYLTRALQKAQEQLNLTSDFLSVVSDVLVDCKALVVILSISTTCSSTAKRQW